LALEDDLDETLGPAVRAVLVTLLFRHDPDLALRHLTTGMPDKAYRTLRPLLPVFPAYYRMRHKIRDANLEAERSTVGAALDRIERQRDGRPYLVGDTFTVADLTAAALLAAALELPGVQYPTTSESPPSIQASRAELLGHPAVRWAAGIYRSHRSASAEVRRPAD